MWPFNYGFAVWGTVVLYLFIIVLYSIWMRGCESGKKKGDA